MQRELAGNRTFFEDPIRSLWVKSLAALIELRLAKSGAIRSDLPRSLKALMIAEMQIALITHWLTRKSLPKAELIAATLIANTLAMLSAFGRNEPPRPFLAGLTDRAQERSGTDCGPNGRSRF
jgi:hypothetical protein